MQQNKIIKKNSDLEIMISDTKKLISSLTDIMNKFNIKINLKIFDFLKCKGLAVSSILSILLILPFYGIATISELMKCGLKKLDFEGKKDVFYDIKNNEFIDWRKLLLLHVKRFRYLIKNNINLISNKITALIFDDTTIEKSGKKIEKVCLVNDHVTRRFILGYKLLVCGFWDGESFIPIDFSLHREKGKKQDDYIKNYKNAVKNCKKQSIQISKLQKSIEKQKEKLVNRKEKLIYKQNKINELNYKKAEQKLDDIENRFKENQNTLQKLEQEKKQAYQELKGYYSKGLLYGLTTKERKEQFKKLVSVKSHGFKRRKESDKDKITSMLEILGRVVKYGILPQYVIVDSWFFCYELLEKLRALKKGAIKLVCMVKINNHIFTSCISNREISVKEMIKNGERNAKKCKKLKAKYICEKCYYKGIRVNLFFVRMKQCKKWHLLLTTDLTLSFIKLMEIYQIRWSIEVFFKESKQYLNLGGCQSNTFDAQIADITLTMMQHIMLSYFKRLHYQQNIGGLFKDLQKELVELDLVTRLIDIFWELVELFSEINKMDLIEIQDSLLRDEKFMIKFNQIIPERVLYKAA
jgi:hypothetical protein